MEVRSANEEVQRFAIEAGQFLEFDHIYPAFPTFTLGNVGLRPAWSLAGNGPRQTISFCIFDNLAQPFAEGNGQLVSNFDSEAYLSQLY